MKKLLSYTTMLCLAMFLFACGSEQGQAIGDPVATDAKTEAAPKAKKIVQKTGALKVGDTAPDFSLKNTKGEMVSLKGMTDTKGYIVTFTCNHCPYSVMYEDRLIALHNKASEMGYPVVAINPNDPNEQPADSYELMIERANEKAFPFEYLFDDGQKIYPKYGATRTPHVFLLDKDLKVKYIGAIDDNARDEEAVQEKYLENAIAAMEAGNDPDPSFTKAIGCSIKAKKKI